MVSWLLVFNLEINNCTAVIQILLFFCQIIFFNVILNFYSYFSLNESKIDLQTSELKTT